MSKKLSLEERLSLATKKGRKKNKRSTSNLSSPSPVVLSNNEQESARTSIDDAAAGVVSIDNAENIDGPAVRSESTVEGDTGKADSIAVDDVVHPDHNRTDCFDDTMVSLPTWLPKNYTEFTVEELVKEISPEYLRLNKQIDDLTNELNRKSQIETTDSSFFKLIKEKDDLIDQLRKEGAKLAETELRQSNQIKALRTKVKDLEYEVSELNDSSAQSVENYNELQSLYHNIQGQLAEATNKLKDADKQKESLETLEKNIKEKDDLITILQQSLDNMRTLLEKEKSEFQTEKKALQEATVDQVTTLETKLEQLRIELDSSTQNLDAKSNRDFVDDQQSYEEKQHASFQYNRLKEQLESSKANWDSIEYALNTKIVNLENRFESTMKEKNDIEEKYQTALRSSETLGKQLEKEKENHSKAVLEVKDLERRVETLKSSLQSISDDYNLLKKKYEIQRSQLEQKENELKPHQENSNEKIIDKIPVELTDSLNSMEGNIEDEWTLPQENSMLSLSMSKLGELESDPSLKPIYNESHETICSEESQHFDRKNVDFSIDDIPEEAAALQAIREGESMNSLNNTSIPYRRASVQLSNSNGHISAHLVNKLSTELKRLEGELSASKELYDNLLKEKTKANDEILRLLEENDKFNEVNKQKDDLLKRVEQMQSKLETSLQLLGEKTEQVEELENDVSDLKEMMHQQVQQMVEMQGKMR
ncbi:AIS_HP2_G0029280.mRNA.1.CDS.1 [Saccharomyces cerevisiae]|nr:Sgm1p [Saccharomyces cerevisiae YJM1242]AJR72905.1 Sgm1p [Saccharomyces cerevisiae YJM1477]CAI5288924.1 AIS_HP2_G0029280.mRNA.1.CDS.1 [Saccharomyces cerevisiae]CAI6591399.1 AIS_HP2_G0029280.mRNA.1.CDS.1 [Saccharomyces cerevisiae]CAI6602860.1 AIS_HP1_G0030780.mRNA.1.CDS.1 [Saccharomyces cerevisiae]